MRPPISSYPSAKLVQLILSAALPAEEGGCEGEEDGGCEHEGEGDVGCEGRGMEGVMVRGWRV